jgi:hypothetical protein
MCYLIAGKSVYTDNCPISFDISESRNSNRTILIQKLKPSEFKQRKMRTNSLVACNVVEN